MGPWPVPGPGQLEKFFPRGYTIINADPAAGTIDIDFVQRHPLGQASRWENTSLLGALPPEHTARAYLVSPDPVDETMPLPEAPDITARWVLELPDGQSLATMLEGKDSSGWYPWIGSESKEIRHAKTPLTQRHHLSTSSLRSQAHWIVGRAMGDDE